MDRFSEERIARNDATFREANERIARTADEQGIHEIVPFICECADERCSEILQLSLEEYESVRADGTLFLNAPGHQRAARGAARVVSQNDRYFVVAKTGHAGEVARALDPRQEDEVA
jgi:hypothetical protein